MLAWLSRRVVKDAWYVVGTWAMLSVVLLAVCLSAPGGTRLFDRFEAGSASVPGTRSAQGEQILHTLAGDSQTVSLLVTGIDISSTDAQKDVASALSGAHTDLRALVGERNVLDPFVVPGMLSEPAAQALASTDLDGFLIIVSVNPNGDAVASADDSAYAAEVAALVRKVDSRLREVPDELHAISPSAVGVVSSDALMSEAIDDQVQGDIVRGGILSLPLTILIMLVAFGGPLLAGAPLLGALASVTGSLAMLYALDSVTDLRSFVVCIDSLIGLYLSVGYGLLLTSRYREELVRHGAEPVQGGRTGRRDQLVARCMTSALTAAGRTVLFSGLAVCSVLVSMTFLGAGIPWSIGVVGAATALISVAAALTLVPALLALRGRRLARPSPVDRLLASSPFRRRTRAGADDLDARSGPLAWTVRQVRRMPWVVLVACIAFLLVVASPMRSMHMLTSTTELLPTDSDQRTYLKALQEDYPAAGQEDATLVIAGTGDRVTSYINESVATVSGVRVLRSATAGAYTVVYLELDGGASSTRAEDAVAEIENLSSPADTWVTGQAAAQLDMRRTVVHGLPWAGLVMVLLVLVLLFAMTGSVLIPLQALLVGALPVAGALGALTWVVQDGHFSRLLDLSPIGGVEAHVVVAAVGIGLAMTTNHGVIIAASIHELRETEADDASALAGGLQRSGRVVILTAFVMMVVFAGFMTGRLLIVKEIGLVLAAAVALDVIVVRPLLLPALMSLFGRWNWWAPVSLQHVRERYLPGRDGARHEQRSPQRRGRSTGFTSHMR